MGLHDIPDEPHFAVTFLRGGVLVTHVCGHNDPESPDEREMTIQTVVLTSWGDEAKRLLDVAAGEYFAARHKWDSRDDGRPVVESDDQMPFPVRDGETGGERAARARKPKPKD